MTQTAPPAEPATALKLHPADILMSLIVTLLTPMFLGVSAGDIGMARMAATETVNAYRARNQADLVAVAQIIAFGLAALGSLSLSMADDISLSMTLRLRGNANALNRSAEQNRRALGEIRTAGPLLHHHHAAMAAEPETPAATSSEGDLDDTEVFLSAEAAKELAAEAEARLRGGEQIVAPLPPLSPAAAMTTEQRHQAMWAIAMVKQAGEITASIANLPPAERRAAAIRAAALNSTANELLTGISSHPPLSGLPAPS